MDRRKFVGIVGSGLLACTHIVGAQQTGKVWRVGFLAGGIRPPDGAAPAPLREELQALGYAEGKDITYEGRWGEGRNERLRELAAALLSRKVDLIVAFGGPAAEAAKQSSSTTPIIVLSAGDVVETGLVASLARPGGNVRSSSCPERQTPRDFEGVGAGRKASCGAMECGKLRYDVALPGDREGGASAGHEH